MVRFTLTITDELNERLKAEAKRQNDSRNHLIFTILNDHYGGNELTTCSRYRMMILRLLDNGQDTNIPQDIRNAAYDLLNEVFADER